MQYGSRMVPHLKMYLSSHSYHNNLGRQIILWSETSLKAKIQRSYRLWWCDGLYRLLLAGIWICDMEGKFWPAIVKHWGLMENIEYFGLFPHLPQQHKEGDHQHDEKCNPRHQASLSEAGVEEGSSNTRTPSTWTPSSQYIPEKPEFMIPTKSLSQIIFYLMTIQQKHKRTSDIQFCNEDPTISSSATLLLTVITTLTMLRTVNYVTTIHWFMTWLTTYNGASISYVFSFQSGRFVLNALC